MPVGGSGKVSVSPAAARAGAQRAEAPGVDVEEGEVATADHLRQLGRPTPLARSVRINAGDVGRQAIGPGSVLRGPRGRRPMLCNKKKRRPPCCS